MGTQTLGQPSRKVLGQNSHPLICPHLFGPDAGCPDKGMISGKAQPAGADISADRNPHSWAASPAWKRDPNGTSYISQGPPLALLGPCLCVLPRQGLAPPGLHGSLSEGELRTYNQSAEPQPQLLQLVSRLQSMLILFLLHSPFLIHLHLTFDPC